MTVMLLLCYLECNFHVVHIYWIFSLHDLGAVEAKNCCYTVNEIMWLAKLYYSEQLPIITRLLCRFTDSLSLVSHRTNNSSVLMEMHFSCGPVLLAF